MDVERPVQHRRFVKSTFSSIADCVEVARGVGADVTAVRDSKHPDGPVLEFAESEWKAFVAGVKAGQFD